MLISLTMLKLPLCCILCGRWEEGREDLRHDLQVLRGPGEKDVGMEGQPCHCLGKSCAPHLD